jgi:hypothetical protein
VELKLKTPRRDGTTHLVMAPLEFMQRLAALVPWPRLHLIRFHGVLAPNAKLRPLVAPQEPAETEQSTEPTAAAECEIDTAQARPARSCWARLLKRVFEIDMQHGLNCGAGGAQDHRRPPGATGDREDPHPPGARSPTAAQGPGTRGGTRRRRLSRVRRQSNTP